MKLIRQDDEYDESKLLFWLICHILLLSLLNLINLNVYVINCRVLVFGLGQATNGI